MGSVLKLELRYKMMKLVVVTLVALCGMAMSVPTNQEEVYGKYGKVAEEVTALEKPVQGTITLEKRSADPGHHHRGHGHRRGHGHHHHGKRSAEPGHGHRGHGHHHGHGHRGHGHRGHGHHHGHGHGHRG